jgi:uncharacterized protein YkwD
MSCERTDTPAAGQALEDFDASVFCMINQQRAAHGRSHLRPDGLLHGAAYDYWTTAKQSTPADVVQAWMTSPEYRKYLLKRRFRDLGVATIRGIPYDPSQTDGITVASEYGFRAR